MQNMAFFKTDGYTDTDSFCTATVKFFDPKGEHTFFGNLCEYITYAVPVSGAVHVVQVVKLSSKVLW